MSSCALDVGTSFGDTEFRGHGSLGDTIFISPSTDAPAQPDEKKAPGFRPAPFFKISSNQARRKSALRRRRIAKPIAPKPISIIAHVAGSGTAATTPADVALTKLEVNGPVVLIR